MVHRCHFGLKLRFIYLKNYNQKNKSDLLVEEAKLLEANSQYAYIGLEDDKEISVSLQDLAPNANTSRRENHVNNMMLKHNLCLMIKTKLLAMIFKMRLCLFKSTLH